MLPIPKGTDPLLTGAGTSAGFTSPSPRGRICRFDKLKVPSLSRDTCVDPLRRRRPELLGHAEM